MPEIIQFSNDLCYQYPPLIALKPYGAARLTPTVGTHYVRTGYVTGKVNEPEAQALAEELVCCCKDPTYDGKSYGVISLLGFDQARRIERLLVERLGPEEMQRRQIACGDAYAFQGDERDVVFLSMVSAPAEGHAIGVLSQVMGSHQRRFNVAASRAREQMILFHSVGLSDLSPHCLRYRLLEYCLSPRVTTQLVGGIRVDELRHLVENADRNRTAPPMPFDSWFEIEVFLRIAERGYRVIPQYEVGGYRIDLVVEGMQHRLAVECDGDQWHGPDRYEQDMSRQRMLERAAAGTSGEYEEAVFASIPTAPCRVSGIPWRNTTFIRRSRKKYMLNVNREAIRGNQARTIPHEVATVPKRQETTKVRE